MTLHRDTLAAIRFGYGFAPGQPAVRADDLLVQVAAPDQAVPAGPDITARIALLIAYQNAKKQAKSGAMSETQVKAQRAKLRKMTGQDFARALRRPLVSTTGFHERLVQFWADHFTVSAKNQRLSAVVAAFREEAIRPHIGGRFGDLLVASSTHPAMLNYLDQDSSFGPNSRAGKRRGRGLNENLAREILELHSVGVDGAYGQGDVREFAELLTGLRTDKTGMIYDTRMAEPGAETVLGTRYGGRAAKLADIHAALHDIALHPDTAQHLARKLAVHFIADGPDHGLVSHMAARYSATRGNLMATYEAMLEHPAAWSGTLAKVKQPWDYVISALRALGVSGDVLDGLSRKDLRTGLAEPMMSMGQAMFRAPGPDGWPEEAAAWITPATLTARLDWAANAARHFAADTDPRVFVETALKDAASDKLRFAAGGAEVKWEGVALVLASPEFNRR